MKQCKVCSTEFEPKHPTRGHEQLYCSTKCRADAYKIRVNEKQKLQTSTTTTSSTPESVGYVQQSNVGVHGYASPINSSVLELIEKRSEAQVDSIRYQLKCEQLEKENQLLQIKVNQLEAELSSFDDEDGGDEGGMLSGIMEQFKKDPVNTIKFGVAMWDGLFSKTKDNGQSRQASTPKG